MLLIDEIDKADIEFPNDLLLELDRMEFYVYETRETVVARQRPIVIITSNNEKELPDAFLRRCFFHYIRFPDRETMTQIVEVHYPGLKQALLSEALDVFYEMRDVPGLKKKPSTSELLDWLKLLLVEDIPPETLRTRDPAKAHPAAARRAPEERAGRAAVRAAGVPQPPRARRSSLMFAGFFLELKRAQVPVSLREYLTLLEAMGKRVAGHSVDDFYYLVARLRW